MNLNGDYFCLSYILFQMSNNDSLVKAHSKNSTPTVGINSSIFMSYQRLTTVEHPCWSNDIQWWLILHDLVLNKVRLVTYWSEGDHTTQWSMGCLIEVLQWAWERICDFPEWFRKGLRKWGICFGLGSLRQHGNLMFGYLKCFCWLFVCLFPRRCEERSRARTVIVNKNF